MKTIEELGDELCNYCLLDEEERSCTSSNPEGCGGCKCEEAYENYLYEQEEGRKEMNAIIDNIKIAVERVVLIKDVIPGNKDIVINSMTYRFLNKGLNIFEGDSLKAAIGLTNNKTNIDNLDYILNHCEEINEAITQLNKNIEKELTSKIIEISKLLEGDR